MLADEPRRRAFRNEVSIVDDADSLAEPGRFFHVVRGVEHGNPESGHRLENGVPALRVHADRRFVQDQELGLME